MLSTGSSAGFDGAIPGPSWDHSSFVLAVCVSGGCHAERSVAVYNLGLIEGYSAAFCVTALEALNGRITFAHKCANMYCQI